MTTTPRCPYCNAQGLGAMAALNAGLYLLVYCGKCGAVHGIIPAPAQPQAAAPEPAREPVTVTDPSQQAAPEPEPPPLPQGKEPQLTPERAYLLQRRYIQKATPRLKIVDPEGEVHPPRER